ncbi:arginine utilization regulatory protein [Sedimentibacter acidaminivorans]|jgi:arginine utilization regulatory protein|uniref:Arginine utilization regulatory protein n=1 Tax=Sedimentibacter acidaminivorans TaxID=913099 RepID=A0ABS4GHY7_9FIRM|nr:sigma 54-interacting transcriptional regulator [Sedimentibacter acidaminivorans]MBP1927310.1 arginine utilization regulatory protein [Sedimentibacter acidaminivorans]
MDYKNILKLISENIYSGIFIVDKNGIVTFYNQSANDLAGVNVENAVGKHLLEIFPKLTAETSTIMRALSTGECLKNYVQDYFNYKSKKTTILSTTIPFYENGQIEGAIEIFSDVDQYKNINQSKYNKKGENNIIEKATYTLNDIVGSSKNISDVKKKVKKIADSKSPVIVYGETGTGKELVVQSIHNESKRHDKPFVAQNCAAIPGTLLESILFGTTLGSFTGARDSKGLIESADGGTLFLDEINSMDITLQAKLLRFLQDGFIRRVGENKIRKVDVRIIAALNEDPLKSLEEGKIRKDLFYRLNVIGFSLIPLRDNRDDLLELANCFLDEFNRNLGKNIRGFSKDVLEFFEKYDWPGNIRELRHSIEHAVNLAEGNIIVKSDIPYFVEQQRKKENFINRYITNEEIDEPLNELLSQYEKRIICQSLLKNDYNISKTSRKLDIPRQTLYYKMDKLGIKVDKGIE